MNTLVKIFELVTAKFARKKRIEFHSLHSVHSQQREAQYCHIMYTINYILQPDIMDLDNAGPIALPASSAGSTDNNTWTPPMGAHHPPASGASPHPLCAGCRLRIIDPFYLCARERSLSSAPQQKWHSHCLKCVECGVGLEDQPSCWEKNGNIFCKEHYYRCVLYCVCRYILPSC